MKVEKNSDFAKMLGEPEKKALCAQVIAGSCSKTFGCCDDKDPALADWVERFVYEDHYPKPLVSRGAGGAGEREGKGGKEEDIACCWQPLTTTLALFQSLPCIFSPPPPSPPSPSFLLALQLPVQGCLHDPSDKNSAAKACLRCKSALSLELTATPEQCPRGGPSLANEKSKEGKKPLEGGGGFMKSFEERCNKLAKKINTRIGEVVSKAAETLCKCAGCCDPSNPGDTCYFPVTQIVKGE